MRASLSGVAYFFVLLGACRSRSPSRELCYIRADGVDKVVSLFGVGLVSFVARVFARLSFGLANDRGRRQGQSAIMKLHRHWSSAGWKADVTFATYFSSCVRRLRNTVCFKMTRALQASWRQLRFADLGAQAPGLQWLLTLFLRCRDEACGSAWT